MEKDDKKDEDGEGDNGPTKSPNEENKPTEKAVKKQKIKEQVGHLRKGLRKYTFRLTSVLLALVAGISSKSVEIARDH